MSIPRTIRYPVRQQDIDSIFPHPAWDDGREGFLWCRFDAFMPSDPNHLCFEVTWDDDSNFEENESGEPTVYFSPELYVEANELTTSETYKSVIGIKIPISWERAVGLVQNDPSEVYLQYSELIDRVRKLAQQRKEGKDDLSPMLEPANRSGP